MQITVPSQVSSTMPTYLLGSQLKHKDLDIASLKAASISLASDGCCDLLRSATCFWSCDTFCYKDYYELFDRKRRDCLRDAVLQVS